MRQCYELDIDIDDSYKKAALTAIADIKGDWNIEKKEKAPIGLITDYPFLTEPFRNIKHLFTNYWKILILRPGESVLPHIDCNGQQQYPEWKENKIVPAVLNIPIQGTGNDATVWVDTDDDIRDPWAFYREDKPTSKFYEIDRFTITDKPVLFNTSNWHKIHSSYDQDRVMISIVLSLDYSWEQMLEQSGSLLIQRD